MALRETLRQRPDVPEADLDDILEIAALRQELARDAPAASREQLIAVAAELDIAPEHVEAAIGELRARRRAEAEARAAAAAAAQRRRAWTLRVGLGSVLLGGALAVGGAALGAGRVDAAAAEAHAAEARLAVVFERQAALAPQIVAAAGGASSEVAPAAQALVDATDLQGRLAASTRLGAAMAEALSRLPPATNAAESTMRLQVQDDLTGTQNRVTVELRRYREAAAAWEAAAGSGLGAWAVTVGMAEGPG